MAKMARATPFLPLPFSDVPSTSIGSVAAVVVVATVGGPYVRISSRVASSWAVVVVTVGAIVTRLAFAFEFVDLLIRNSKWMRNPFLPATRVNDSIVASPRFSSIRRCFACPVMVILYVNSYRLCDLIIPDRSSVYTFRRYPSDSSIGLNASSGTQSPFEVSYTMIDQSR